MARGVLSLNGMLTVGLGIIPGPLLALCAAAALSIFP